MNEKSNKNKIIVSVIIIAAVIALAAGGVAAYSFFSPITIDGGWEMVVNPEVSKATADEAENSDKVFYSFEKPGEYGDGKYKTYYQGGVEEGNYKLSEKDGKKLINLGTKDMEYKTEGIKLFGSAKLTITYPETTDEQSGQITPAQDYVFATAKAPDYEKESYGTFKTDSALLGKWVTAERKLAYLNYDLSYTETVEFKDNGIMTIHYESSELALDRFIYYAYTTDESKLTFSLVTEKDKEYNVSYQFDKDENLKFIDDTTDASIFADAFFSDVTYVKAD